MNVSVLFVKKVNDTVHLLISFVALTTEIKSVENENISKDSHLCDSSLHGESRK